MGATLGNQNYAWWVGADGNAWANIRGVGVRNLGPASLQPDGSSIIMSFADTNMPSDYLQANQRIADPSGSGGSTAPSRTSSGGAAAPVLNTAAVDATGKAINSLGVEQDTGYKNIDDSFSSLMGKYGNEASKAEADYTEQGVTNNTNFTKNKQNALVAAAQGRRGLRGTLASLGALSGTGAELADRAVTTGANQDIGEATDTAKTNAVQLDKAIGNFRDEDRDRRAEAETTKVNQRTALEGSIAAKRQQFYQKMAELFAEGGDTGGASTWLNRAGDLNNEIASKTRVAATPFTERAAAFTPGDLENYLAGAGDMTVSAEGGPASPLNPTSILAGRKRKKEELAAAV